MVRECLNPRVWRDVYEATILDLELKSLLKGAKTSRNPRPLPCCCRGRADLRARCSGVAFPGLTAKDDKGESGRATGRTQPGWAAELHQGAGKLKLHQRETAKGIFNASCQLWPHIKMWHGLSECTRESTELSHLAQGSKWAQMSLFVVPFWPQVSYGGLTSTHFH